MKTETNMKTTFTKLPATKDTREKFEAIIGKTGWSLTRAVEKAAEALAQREGVQLSGKRRKAS